MLKLLLIFLLCVPLALGQGGLAQPRAVTIRIQVRYDKDNGKVRDAEVELMDAVGGSSAMDKKITDTDGIVEFRSLTGAHRVRITGAEIETWEGQFEVTPSETLHFEQVRVKARPPVGGSPAPERPVSAAHLKVPGAARKQYERGMKALEKQQWSEAKTNFESAIAAYEAYDTAHNGLGFADIRLGDTEGARKEFARAIELNPSYAEALRNLARIYLGEKRFADAIPLLSRSLSTEPVNGWAAVNLAYANLEAGKYEEAVTWGIKAHDLPPEDSAGHYIAGCALDAMGKKAEAIQQFEIYLQEDPQGANARAAREFLSRLAAAK